MYTVTILHCIYVRYGEDWKRARSAVNNQIKPANVQTYTAGINDDIARFIEHIRSIRDAQGRISDIGIPLKRLMTASERLSTCMHACKIIN